MSTPTDLPTVPKWEPTKVPARSLKAHKPLNTLVASASRLTKEKLEKRLGQSFGTQQSWQDDAWEMFDLVGEQRFLATTLAGRLSQARFYVGTLGDNDTEHPEPVDDENLTGVLDSIGESRSGLSQLVYRLAINLFIAGDGWLVGIPKHYLGSRLTEDPNDFHPDGTGEDLKLSDLEWRMLSVSEIKRDGMDRVKLMLGENGDEQITANPDDLYAIRVWRPHPQKSWEADSATRSSLPILRELVGLTMHISAQVDSRLAGAGLLIVPQSAQRALQVAAGLDADSDEDQFTEALIEAMITPIQDRSSASAVVPLVVTVPDEVTDSFNHISFSTPLDSEARNLRDEAIRRLALGQDAPPELLLGTAGMNHWGAWLVREDVVNTHLEPPLSLICDALTTQFLWPVLEEQGYSAEEVQKYVVWFDVSDLVVRPNRSDDARALHQQGVINDKALRRESGFDEADSPEKVDPPDERPEVQMALDLVQNNPGLLASPGLPSVVAQIKEVMDNPDPSVAPLGEEETDTTDASTDAPSLAVPSREQPAGAPGGPQRPERAQVPTRSTRPPIGG